MNHDDELERLRELVIDERARRAYAEEELAAERRRTQIWRSRAEERKEALRRRRKTRGGVLGRVVRSPKQQTSLPGVTTEPPPEKEPARPPVALLPYQPTLRIAAWKAPDWLPWAAECLDLARDPKSLAAADMVLVAGEGALAVLSDWLTWPARQPLVLWDCSESEAEHWIPYLTGRDLMVGPRPWGAAKQLSQWPVADPRQEFPPPNSSVDNTPRPAGVETPKTEIVARALHRTPMEWAGPELPAELAGLVVEADADRHKAGVVARLLAAEMYNPGAAIGRIADQVGIRLPPVVPSVGILLVTKWPDRLAGALQQISRLRYPRFEVVVGLHGTGPVGDVPSRLAALGLEEKVRLLHFDARFPLGECLNRAAEATGASVLAKFDDDDRYGSWYLNEAVDALTATGAELVGKATQYVHLTSSDRLLLFQPGKEHSEVGYVNGPTFVMPRHTWEQVRFPHRRSRVDSIFVRGLKAVGGTIWSTSRHEFILGRHAGGHTWEATDERFLASSEVVGSGADDAAVWLDGPGNWTAGTPGS